MRSRNQGGGEEEEGEIPVLTVLKNNTVLKNIFVVNKPPEEDKLSREDHEDFLLVGRHPDCDLMLTHPSISRFHLQIRSRPSSRTFSVLDLSSVHGTWVSERKIEPMVSVEMKEGDTLRIGVSSRVYRLHWIPISQAYDLENPFLSQLDVVVEEEQEEEDEEYKVRNSMFCPAEMEKIESVDSILLDINSTFLYESEDLYVKEENPLATSVLEDMVSLCCQEERKSPSKEEAIGIPCDLFGAETSLPMKSDCKNKLCDSPNQALSPPCVESVVEHDEMLTESLFDTVCLPAEEAVSGTKMQLLHTPPDTFSSPLPPGVENSVDKHYSSLLENTAPVSLDEKSAAAAVIIPEESESGGMVSDVFTAGAESYNSENQFLPVEEAKSGIKFQQIKVVEEVATDSLSDENKEDMYRSLSQLWNDKLCHDQGHSHDEILQDIGNKYTSSISPTSDQIGSVNLPMPQVAVLKITDENQTLQPDMEILESCVKAPEKKSASHNIWSRRGKAASAPQVRTSIHKSTATEVSVSNEKDILNKTISKNLLSVLDGEVEEEEEEEIYTPDKENFSPNTLQLRFQKKRGMLEEIKYSKSQRLCNSKGKFKPDICTNESIGHASRKKNQKDIVNKTITKNLFSVMGGEKEEEEIFTPNKENFSPHTLQLQLLKKQDKLEEIKHSKSPWPQISKNNFGHNIYPDENMSPTLNTQNQTPKGAQVQKLQRKPFSNHIKLAQEQDVMAFKDRVERVPFQSLKNSGGKRTPVTFCLDSTAKSIDFSNCGEILAKRINPSDICGVQKKSWDMIVDTSSLLDKESRKALQLLQGLKGTRLIIPRLVIRELDNMKRHLTIFRRISEASLALEWIEECMLKTNWWIHIQSSVDEGRLIAPTPPASPQTQFSEENWNFIGGVGSSQPLSSHKFSMEVTSPTVEDHILDYLLYRRNQNDGQLVLLSEDVTLKIKCMAEGLLCETVKEFRESLVNPFSKRFLWTNSSARGQTWSCQDDVVLREKYCPLPLRKSSKGVASGLKLILLHNSQYGH
ncbi:hypothetical protein RJT34_26604 [Clitoria ternatea]|uniref:FHA domain-containing protein n=1 Tax=Clitoria ternatea TaxID=43366 RepID=A0AAN9F915_CLITE